MKRILSIAIIVMMAAGVSNAQSVKLIAPPAVKDMGTTLNVCGTISGLESNQTVTISVRGKQDVTTTCINPGSKTAPGQTQVVQSDFTVTKSVTANASGNADFCVETTEPSGASCPNEKWTSKVSEVSYSDVKVMLDGRVLNE